MYEIKQRLYRVRSSVAGFTHYYDLPDDKAVIQLVASKYPGSPVSVVEMKLDGKTPKVAIYTHPDFKKLAKVKVTAEPIIGRIYRVRSTVSCFTAYVVTTTEEELMQYMVGKQGMPCSVVWLRNDGTTPKVSVYTNPYYRTLLKGDKA